MKQRIFIGSSKENLRIAYAVQANLEQDHVPTVWDQGIFELSKSVLDSLVSTLDRSDAAVFVLSPDDVLKLRDTRYQAVRDNVIFELGLFLGRLGVERTYMIVPRDTPDLRIPSDLCGITPATYDPRRDDGNWQAALGPACHQVREALVRALSHGRPGAQPGGDDDVIARGLLAMHRCHERLLAHALASIPQKTAGARRRDLHEGSDGFALKLGRAELKVRFGRIENSDATEAGSVVALPANEYFDDACIDDPHSALGAYIQHAFPGDSARIQRLVFERLRSMKSDRVEREHGAFVDSYGVGRYVFLDGPLGSRRRVLLVSVTTKRAGVGLHAEPHFLFAAMRAIAEGMSEHRLTDVHLPLMGSGHGGLPNEIALLYTVMAIREALEEPAGKHLRAIDLVVFRKSPESEPSLPRETVKRILSFTTGAGA